MTLAWRREQVIRDGVHLITAARQEERQAGASDVISIKQPSPSQPFPFSPPPVSHRPPSTSLPTVSAESTLVSVGGYTDFPRRLAVAMEARAPVLRTDTQDGNGRECRDWPGGLTSLRRRWVHAWAELDHRPYCCATRDQDIIFNDGRATNSATHCQAWEPPAIICNLSRMASN